MIIKHESINVELSPASPPSASAQANHSDPVKQIQNATALKRKLNLLLMEEIRLASWVW